MEILTSRFAKKSKTVRLPDGRLVKVTEEPTGLTSVIRHTEDSDHLHGLVRPQVLAGSMSWR